MAEQKKPKQVRIGKIDLDTCGAAMLLGVERGDEIKFLPSGIASSEDLLNPNIICIEVGGSGQVNLNNWDHHGEGGEKLFSATRQVIEEAPLSVLEENFSKWKENTSFQDHFNAVCAAEVVTCPACSLERALINNLTSKGKFLYYMAGWFKKINFGQHTHPWSNDFSEMSGSALFRLIHYIDELDRGVRSKSFKRQEERFPTLSDVFSGMLLASIYPVEQFHLGIEMLREVDYRCIDAYGRMPIEEISEWRLWSGLKKINNKKVLQAITSEASPLILTNGGRKIAWIKTDLIGAPGKLYGIGAEIAVVYSEKFGPNKVPKFTISGNNVRIDGILNILNEKEPGWGGHTTIIGSPREGSKLTLEEVIKIVKKHL